MKNISLGRNKISGWLVKNKIPPNFSTKIVYYYKYSISIYVNKNISQRQFEKVLLLN